MAANRRPAVAGAFYPGRRDELGAALEACLPEPGGRRVPVGGVVVPHAGYVYSGRVAGAVFGAIEIPERAVLLGPNHTGLGAGAAVDPSAAWDTPLGSVPVDQGLSERIRRQCPDLQLDAMAHLREHSLEVEIPFLQRLRPEIEIVAICLGAPRLDLCRAVGSALAGIVRGDARPPLLVASSDMNHYESRAVGDRKNALALDRILAIDPEGLFETVLSAEISMCGFLPVTALLFAARDLGWNRAEIVAQADSGDVTGEVDSVVGYAGLVIGAG
jgi:AmmeMemoRadiSam system protein B